MTKSLSKADLSVTEIIQSKFDNIQFHYIGRNDIDIKGYAAYMFHFKRVGPCHDLSLREFIISSSDIHNALSYFENTILPTAIYKNAVYSVEIIGSDFNPTREDALLFYKL